MKRHPNRFLLLIGLLVSLWPELGVAESSVSDQKAALVFIDTKTILRDSEPVRSGKSQSEVIALANTVIKQFADRHKVGLVLQEVVYASPRVNITSKVLDALAGLRNDEEFEIPQLRVGFVKTRELLSVASSRWDLEQSDPTLIEKLNEVLRRTAMDHNVDLIFQEAVYVSASADITSAVAHAIKGLENIGMSVGVELDSNTVRFIDAQRVLNESVSAMKSEAPAKKLFGSREDDLKKVIALTNKRISMVANTVRIHLILQQAVYVAPSFDITEAILSSLDVSPEVEK